MAESSNQPNIFDLTEAHLHGLLKDDQVDALNGLLLRDPAARERCVMAFEIMSMVHEEFRRREENTEIQTGEPLLKDFDAIFADLLHLEHEAAPLPRIDASRPTKEQPDRQQDETLTMRQLADVAGYLLVNTAKSGPAKWLAAAAVIVLAATLYIVLSMGTGNDGQPTIAERPGNDTPSALTQPIVATLTAAHDAQWAERALARGSDLKAGQRLTLTAGFAEITTQRGAIAILEAPATIELIDSPNAIRLHAGKLVGIVQTESAKGFIVRTPHMDVVDLGTEFGVDARPDAVEVSVFVGEVEVVTPNREPQRLTQQQSAKLTVHHSNTSLVIEDAVIDGFTRRVPRSPVVTAAHINLDGFELQVVPQGVREDAKLYTDRVHELNGLDDSGLPALLLGGDLVRTPADARTQLTRGSKALRVELELAQPATVYLLYNSAANPPDWMTRDYQLTEMRVGLDFSKDARKGWNPLGIGPGQGIDQTLAVWRRKHAADGRVMVTEHATTGMYAIVVVPIEERGRDGL